MGCPCKFLELISCVASFFHGRLTHEFHLLSSLPSDLGLLNSARLQESVWTPPFC